MASWGERLATIASSAPEPMPISRLPAAIAWCIFGAAAEIEDLHVDAVT